MGYWEKPNKFKVRNFMEIPMGNHRVKITDVRVENFTKTKKKCFELSLEVSGYPGRLWYHLWYSPSNKDRTNADFYAFFNGFQIEAENRTLRRYKKWVGRTGAVSVWHEHGPTKYLAEDEYEAMVSHILSVKERDKLPLWSDIPTVRAERLKSVSSELPFF